MSDCPNIAKCIFFNDKMANKPATAEMMKKGYCKDRFADCARYMVCVALGGPKVPADLFPNMVDKAKIIIAAAKPA
jgi:hypothetical protein